MNLESMRRDLDAIGDRRVPVDKSKWLNQPEGWTNLIAMIPLCPEVTPRFYDLITETRIHLEELERRAGGHKPFRFIDTPTADLLSGVGRAFSMLEVMGLIKESKPVKEKNHGSETSREEDSGSAGVAGKGPRPVRGKKARRAD